MPGVSSGEAIEKMERISRQNLPNGFSFEWTQLTYQEVSAGITAIFIFPLCVLFVFLALAAQYESWSLPFSVLLCTPIAVLGASGGAGGTGGCGGKAGGGGQPGGSSIAVLVLDAEVMLASVTLTAGQWFYYPTFVGAKSYFIVISSSAFCTSVLNLTPISHWPAFATSW